MMALGMPKMFRANAEKYDFAYRYASNTKGINDLL